MSHELTRHQILEDLPAYVLGALEPEHMLAVDRYLQEDADLQLLVRLQELEEATTWLALTADPVPLPPSVKEELMARVQADLASESVQIENTTAKSWFADLNEWFSMLFRPVAWATAGGLVVAVLAFGNINNLQSSLNDAQNQAQALQTEVQEAQGQAQALQSSLNEAQGQAQALQTEVQEANEQITLLEDEVQELETGNQFLQQTNRALEQQIQQNQNLLAVVATAEDQVALSGTDAAPSSRGTLFFASNNSNEGVLVLDGLAPLSEDETYQLWLIPAEGDPLSVGLVDIADSITNSHLISLPPDASEYAAVGLSQESAGGSPSPTLVVMVGVQE